MNRSLFQETCQHLFRSSKNRLAIILTFLAIISYSAFFLPQMNSWDTINLEKLHLELLANKGIMEDAVQKGNFQVNEFTGQSAYQQSKYHYEYQRALNSSILHGDAERYSDIIDIYMPPFYFDELNEYYLENSLYPGKDQTYDSMNFRNRMNSYREEAFPLTFSVIQQKTSWQQIQLFFLNSGPAILIIFTLFIASDVFVLSRKARTQQLGIPISWNRQLFIQSLAVLTFLVTIFLSAGLLFYVTNGLLHGFGSFLWKIPAFEYNENYVTDPDVYQLMSIGSFLLKILPYLLMMLYLFVRLTVLFSLVFRQEVMVFLTGIFLLLFEQLYFSRTTRRLFGIEIGYFPQTYFDFGKVIVGEKNYLLNTNSITYNRGVFLLLGAIIALEIIISLAARWRNRQKFIQ